jgi:hypothetical protein
MTHCDERLAIQRGAPSQSLLFDDTPRYLYNGRALGDYAHRDAVFQAYFNVALIISDHGPDALDAGTPIAIWNWPGRKGVWGAYRKHRPTLVPHLSGERQRWHRLASPRQRQGYQ